jgi:uncharacterized protein
VDLLLKLALVAAAAYLGLVGVMYAMQRKMMYYPVRTLPSPAAVGAPDLYPITLVTDDGLALTAWRKPASVPDGYEILYFHGNGGNIADRAGKVRPFLDAGFGILLVSYRGYGGNPGSPSEAGFFADARAAYDALLGEGVAPERIALIGESLGSGVAVYLASERKVGAVLLEAPYTSTVDVGQRAYPFVPVRLLMQDRFDSASRIARVTAPLLIVHGEADAVIPAAFGRRLFAAANEPKEAVFIPAGDHGNLELFGLQKMQLDFLARHLGAD